MNKEKIRKQVTGAMFVVGAAVASSYGVTKYLLKAALDRESPKAPKRAGNMISKSNKGDDYLSASREASKKLSEASHEIVRIKSFDNIELLGHWFPAQNPKRIIIAMHGWRSSWSRDFGLISEFWLNSGCSVLFAEQRGQNGSGGDYMGFGMIERFDCKSWCEWAAEKDESSPIYLAGVSMGAASVLMASNLPLSDRLHGIMADCGFTSARAIWKHVANNNLHIAYEIRSSIADSICRKKIHRSNFDPILTWYIFRKQNISFISKEENFKIPIFGRIIHRCCFMAIDRKDPRNALVTINKAAELITEDIVSIGIYPEGTRSKECVLLPFHAGVFKIAQKAQVPVVVMTIAGTEKIHRNIPFRKTYVDIDVIEVIPPEALQKTRTAFISDSVKARMEENLRTKK